MTDIHRLGTEQTKAYALAAGASVEIDADLDQVLIKELVGAAEIGLEVNHGPLSSTGAFKGKELTGAIRHLRFTNNSAAAVALELVMVKGLASKDNRLTQVGAAFIQPQPFATFQPIGAFTIPARTVQRVVTADDARNRVLLTNLPGQFRELYISGDDFGVASQISFPNPGFETGVLTGWTEPAGPTGNWAVRAAGGVITPQAGGFAMIDSPGSSNQHQVETVSSIFSTFGLTDAQVDAGAIGYAASVWVASEESGGSSSFNLTITWELAGGIDVRVDSVSNFAVDPYASAGWEEITLSGLIPATARQVRVNVHDNTTLNRGEAGIDSLSIGLTGVAPTLDGRAGVVLPAQMVEVPTNGDLYVFNPHVGSQVVLVGEVRN